MKIYNSLTNKKEEFETIKPKTVNMYTCGVTVYDESHVGHARSLYVFDVMRRYLEYRGYKVNFVRNITDIDDKIINRAKELKVDWKELVSKYIESYNKDLGLLNIRKGILDKDKEEPRATKTIADIIEYIKVLIDKGYAYKAGGDVYFNVKKFSGYGKLSGQNIDQMREGVRIEPDEKKQDALDFALWKTSKEGEPSWDSPWGGGRPGWHIECSVMSQKFLKTDTLDIHAGGRDLIFPHHENEIAQAEARTGKPFAKYWIHHGLLTINGQKMAKSLGNFITIKAALKKYDAETIKFFMISSHYSQPIDFSDERMNEAKAALERFYILFDKVNRLEPTPHHSLRSGAGQAAQIDALKEKFIEAMDDDFNTPQALACLFDMLREANKSSDENMLYAATLIKELGGIFGLFLRGKQIDAQLETYVESKISERNKARNSKDFKKADLIRQELKAKGIAIEDTKEGTVWRPA
ncbi:MAG: cysteine--tRNA ligase [Candidatus Omnitrophota bacterium]